MTNLTPIPELTPVRQFETSDLVLAGPGQPMNQQSQALLNRIEYVLDQTSTISSDLDQKASSSDLSDSSDVDKGAALIGWRGKTIGQHLDLINAQQVNLAEFFVGDPSAPGAFNIAMDAAQLSLTRPGTIIIPPGFFTITSTVFLRVDIPIRLVGAGMYSTVIACTAAMTGLPMIKSDAPIVDSHRLGQMTLLGGGFAAFGYQCEHLIHSDFDHLQVQGTTVYGIRTNDGYNVNFNRVEIFLNSGGGIDVSGVNNNNVNFNGINVYGNGGIGVQLANGWGLTLNGCSIEANAIAGLMCWDLRGLSVNGGYMERNGGLGYAYTIASGSPENLTVKADIHLLSGGRLISLSGQRVTGASIRDVSFTPFGAGDIPAPGIVQDCIIFCPAVDNLTVESCDIYEPQHVRALVGLYNNNTRSELGKVRIERNTLNNVVYLGAGIPTFSFSTAHNVENSGLEMPFNYASQTRADYTVQAGTTGALTDGAERYGGAVAWNLSTGDHVYGLTVDLSQRTELRGKYVWFGLAYRVQEAATGLLVIMDSASDNDGTITEGVTEAGVWKFKSVLKYVDPGATSISIAFKRIGAGTQPLVVAAPSLAVFGAGLNTLNTRR